MVAAYHGHTSVVRILLHAGATVNMAEQVRYTITVSCQILGTGARKDELKYAI